MLRSDAKAARVKTLFNQLSHWPDMEPSNIVCMCAFGKLIALPVKRKQIKCKFDIESKLRAAGSPLAIAF